MQALALLGEGKILIFSATGVPHLPPLGKKLFCLKELAELGGTLLPLKKVCHFDPAKIHPQGLKIVIFPTMQQTQPDNNIY